MPSDPIDAIDRRILRALQANGRISNVELADQVHLSPTPCLRRLRKLEAEGLIRSYAAILDEKALGFAVSAFVFVKLERNTEDNAQVFENAVQDLPEVMECNVVTGAHDYALRVVARDLASYDAFVKHRLANIGPVAEIQTMIILNRPLARGRLPL